MHRRPTFHDQAAAPRDDSPLDGVLIVDKPAGPTSHDIVDRIRRILGMRKVGHGGTLDPMATGVLILLIGRGTKLSDHFLGADKAYEGTIRLGISTDSHDAMGEVTAERDASGITEALLLAHMKAMMGDQMQTPPQVSAVKVKGVPLYKSARKGKIVEVKPRLVRLYEFSLLSFDPPNVDFRMRCTKGTYVRKCADDLGEVLGCGGHLSRLRRTQSGEFSIADAITMSELVELSPDAVIDRILPMKQFAARRALVQRPR